MAEDTTKDAGASAPAPEAPPTPKAASKPKAEPKAKKPKAAPKPKPAPAPKEDAEAELDALAASLDIDSMLTGGKPVPGSGITEDDLAGGSPIDEPALRLRLAKQQLEQIEK